jgi:glycosyltransferase involved in cell wall biosynthesis
MISGGLAERGHGVRVWTTTAAAGAAFWDPRAATACAGEFEVDGVRIRRFPLRHLPGHWRAARLLGMLWPPARPRWEPPSPWAPELWRQVRRPPAADVVHATCFPFDGVVWAAREAARRLDVPLVVTPLIHLGADPHHRARFYERPWQRQCLREAQAVLVLSEAEGRHLCSLGVEPGAVVLTEPALDLAQVPPADPGRFRVQHGLTGPLVVHVANLSRAKGTLDLVEAGRILGARCGAEAPTIVLIGQADEEVQAALGARRTEDRRCICLGRVDEQTKHDALAAATVFCLPSAADAFGIAFLEAWAHRTPVIGAEAGGIPDLLRHGQAGRLAPFGAPEALAEVIEGLLTDEAGRRALGEVGHDLLVSRYNSPRLLDRVEAVYEAVVRGESPAEAVRERL